MRLSRTAEVLQDQDLNIEKEFEPLKDAIANHRMIVDKAVVKAEQTGIDTTKLLKIAKSSLKILDKIAKTGDKNGK